MAISQPRDVQPVVLLVQHSADDREMYAEFLRYRRFRPTIAVTIAEALELAPTADVIVTGIALPNGADGLDFIEQIRRDPDLKTTPIIVLTATLLDPERQRAVEAGCDGFLRKPCLPGALVREVRRVLAAARLAALKQQAADMSPPTSVSRKAGRAPRRPR